MFELIGAAISVLSSATSIVNALATALKAVGVALIGAGHIIENFGKNLGIIKNEEDTVTLGRQCQAAEEEGIKPDDFESFDEYVAKVREIHVDENINVDELENKDEITRKGMEIIMGLAVEKFGQTTIEKVGDIIGKDPEKADLVLNSKAVADFVSNDNDNLDRVADYLKGDNQSAEVRDVIRDGISSAKPDLSEGECFDLVKDMREVIEGSL